MRRMQRLPGKLRGALMFAAGIALSRQSMCSA
jgi:hypothetical protein